MTMQDHLKESVLKIAIFHHLKNREKSPERTVRNIRELLGRFDPAVLDWGLEYGKLLDLVQKCSREECLNMIMEKLF